MTSNKCTGRRTTTEEVARANKSDGLDVPAAANEVQLGLLLMLPAEAA